MPRIRTILIAAATPAALAALLLGTAGQAGAAVTTAAPAAATLTAAPVNAPAARAVIAHTWRAGVVDTTGMSGSGTIPTPYGPQWATDDLGVTFTVRPVAGQPDTWTVRADSAGTFAANADPRTGEGWQGHGAVAGWVNYTVSSKHAPNARNLPAREAGSLSTSDLLRLLFGDPSAQVTGGHYWFGYWPVNGQLYTQQG